MPAILLWLVPMVIFIYWKNQALHLLTFQLIKRGLFLLTITACLTISPAAGTRPENSLLPITHNNIYNHSIIKDEKNTFFDRSNYFAVNGRFCKKNESKKETGCQNRMRLSCGLSKTKGLSKNLFLIK